MPKYQWLQNQTKMSAEEKRKRIAAGVSITLHVALLLLFIFLIAWREPDPPLPEYGIELNFGLDDAGSGDVQPETQPVQTEQQEEPAEEEPVEEVQETTPEPVEPVDEVIEETVEEVTPTPVPQHDSPDVIEEKPVEEKKEEVKPVEQPKKQEPTPDPRPVEEKTEPVKSGNSGEADSQQNTSQGDKTDAQGDQGDPEGSVDSRALYGKTGGGGGLAVSLSGWKLDGDPKVNDTSNEEGRIVFEIQVDDNGEIIGVRVLERTVTAAVARKYQEAVQNLTFSPTAGNTRPAPISKGTITFTIKAK